MFRYKDLGNSSFRICSGDKMAIVSKNGRMLSAQTFTDTDDSRYWKRYLNLSFDPDALEERMSSNPFLQKVFDYNRGLYLLKQDPWECLVCFIISQRKRIDQICICVEKLCEVAGTRVPGRNSYYTFPTPQQILDADLSEVPLGYREDYVHSAAKACADGWINLAEMVPSKSTYLDAGNLLCDIYGVGPKVANCVLLFGLGYTNAFPVDVHIQRVLDLPEMKGFDYHDFGDDAGIVQQYLFNYAINHGI